MTNVSEHAVIQRINRKLRTDDQVLKTSRSARLEQNVGRYYILDWRMNAILDTHVSPESLGRELGVLGAWERVVQS